MSKLIARPPTKSGVHYAIELCRRFKGLGLIEMASVEQMYASDMPTEQRRPYEMVDGVAIICVSGVLCNDPGWWDETGYEDLQCELEMAANDSAVRGVLLNINSPGGETDNAFETAAVVRAVADVKPVWAIANPIAYSAAYLLGSQAEMMYTPKDTGGVGSIGVYQLHLDFSGMLKAEGIVATFMSAGEGKTDFSPLQPLSPAAKQRGQMEVNRLYALFVQNVASGRGLSESAIVKLGAFRYDGSQQVLGAGLADRAGTLDDALTNLSAALVAGNGSAGTAGALTKRENQRMERGTQTGAITQPVAPPPGGTAAAAPLVAQPVAVANAAAPATAPAEIPVTVSVEEARASGYAEAQSVMETCNIAGRMDLLPGFIAKKASIELVQKTILEAQAASTAGHEISSGILPGTGAHVAAAPRVSLKVRAEAMAKREGLIK